MKYLLDTAQLKKNKSAIVLLAIIELLRQPQIASKFSACDLVAEYAGCLDDLPEDLSSNEKHMNEYGK